MNKPAAKEPSMDEILSSIRQIIADDDAAPDTAPAAKEPAAEDGDDFPSFDSFATDADGGEDDGALALSSEQIVEEDPVELDMTKMLEEDADSAEEEIDLAAELVVPDDIAFDALDDASEPEPAPEPATSIADAAPMPDPDLSGDMAAELLQPATEQAVGMAFAKLGAMSLGTDNLTIETMIRELLRPMLKEWLDENLPSVVERMVEKEIERVSRGGR